MHSQVGIGTTQPSSSTLLDIFGNNKGILIPRVSLTSITDIATITSGNLNSLLVYNTNNVTGVITPGYYYWLKPANASSGKWMRLTNQDDLSSVEPWQVSGTTEKTTEKTQHIYIKW